MGAHDLRKLYSGGRTQYTYCTHKPAWIRTHRLNRLGKSRFFEADLFQTALGAPCLVRPENPSLFLRRPSPSLVRFARAILSDKTKIRQFVYLRNVCMTSLISLILSKPDSKCISYFIANCTCS